MIPTPDMMLYRKGVRKLLEDKDKYPAMNEVFEIAKRSNTVVIMAYAVTLVMNEFFEKNAPIAECARHLEATAKLARQESKEVIAKVVLEALSTEDRKVH